MLPVVANAVSGANPLLFENAQALNPGLHPRGLPNALNGYAPTAVSCPSSRPTIRNAASLSNQESQWLQSRRNATINPMIELLNRISIPGFDGANYVGSNQHNVSALPNIGIAVSGGGYRALLNGGGVLSAFDSRTDNSTASGHIGGLLQSSTYLAGLSGGGWLVSSLYANNFTSVEAIVSTNNSGLWDLSNSIFQGPNSIPGLSTLEYYNEIQDAVSAKREAPYNFNVSVTDYWGRALSYQLINDAQGGINYTWSSVAQQDFFTNGSVPMPILISDERAPGQIDLPTNTTVYEFNPWELGSWDPTLYGFAPIQYAGSNFTNGMIPQDQSCITGFDNLGYVVGTTSTLFNQFFLQFNTSAGNTVPQFIKDAVNSLLGTISSDNNDIADWSPNPFYGYNNATNQNHASSSLTLVDGGEDFQNIPLHPLIQPVREVDVIFAIDSSADTNNSYPNGTALVATYQRSSAVIENGTAFPYIPDQQTIVNLGLNTRPTFFGCDANNYTTAGNSWPGPLLVYLPNTYYVVDSGVSTFTDSYNTSYRNAMIENGYASATMANGTLDNQWPVCVGCAMLQRSIIRTGTPMPDACQQCFQRYCWDGTLNTTASNFTATPKVPGGVLQLSSARALSPTGMSVTLVAVVASIWMVML